MQKQPPIPPPDKDPSTEEKIMAAARELFTRRGFAATTMRDIAKQADINLALVNYYFRTKANLFDIVMATHLQTFAAGIMQHFDNPDTTLTEKIDLFVKGYIDMLLANPDLPLFVLTTIRSNPERFIAIVGVKSRLMESVFIRQYHEAVQTGTMAPLHPAQFMMNMLGTVIFPFIARPMIQATTHIDDNQWLELIQQRKTLIPQWIHAMMKVK